MDKRLIDGSIKGRGNREAGKRVIRKFPLYGKNTLILGSLLILLCLGASFSPFGCSTGITGIVTDPGGDPVKDATVTIEGYDPVETGEDGSYTIEDIPYGEVIITVTHEDYQVKHSTINTSYIDNGITCKEIDADIRFTLETGWQDIGVNSASSGGISNTSGSSSEPSLAIDAFGYPVVTWQDNSSGNYEIYVKQWNGTDAWEEIGTGSASGGGISSSSADAQYPSMEIDGSGNPVIAWTDSGSGNWEIYVKQWNGTSWVELGGSASGGGISNNSGISNKPCMVLDESDYPIIAWHDSTSEGVSNYQIYFKQWNGSNWIELGGSATDGGVSNSSNSSMLASVAINNSGNPVIAWQDDTEVYLKQWNGTDAWEAIGGSATGDGLSSTSGESLNPSLSINSSGNPVVTWEDDSTVGNFEIYVKQWNGSSWEAIGGSASSGGISNTVFGSHRPSVIINGSDNPVITWSDSVYMIGGNQAIYVRQWDGTAWEELEDSARFGGISTNYDISQVQPSIKINNLGYIVIAWSAGVASDTDIYIKQYIPNN